MKNRLLSILLCLVLCVSMFPAGASAECEHSLVKVNAKSTCAEAYMEHYKCTICGELFLDPEGEQSTSAAEIVLPKPVHESELQYVAADETVSCIKTGNGEYWFCPDCKQKYATNDRSQPISDSRVLIGYGPHTIDPESFHPAVDPTCDQSGNVAYYTCSVCDKKFADAEGETLLENVTVAPRHTLTEHPAVARTCTQNGSRKYYSCSVCGAFFDENYQPIQENEWIVTAGHDFVGHPETAPTCSAEGNALYYTCNGCGIIVDASGNVTSLDAVTTAKLPHSITIHVEAEPKTCEDSGNVEYWECEVCGARFADSEGSIPLDNVIIPPSHNFVATEAHAATCTDDGNIAYWTCRDCEKIFNADGQQIWLNDTIDKAHGHTTERIPAQAATCTEAGHMEYYRCTDCQNLFSDPTGTYPTTLEAVAITALGHEYSWDGICMRCGAVRILDGDEGVVASGSAYSIRLDQDYEAVKDHITVAVDGQEVAREYITVTEGSTIVTLSGEFVSTLDAGEHSIAVSTPNGTAAGSFTVAAQRRLMSSGLRADNPGTYAITFNPANTGTAYIGTSTEPVTSAASGQTIRIVANVPLGRQFCRWEGTEGITFANPNSAETTFTMPNKAVTLSAVMMYNVTFDMNGHGTAPEAQYVAPGGKATRPTTPTIANYVFGNWYADEACTTLFDFNTAITMDTTVYAKWRCQVTFYTNHGTAPTAKIVDIGATATKPTDLSWIGYKWGGWCSDDDWKNAFDFKTPITSDTVLFAKWIPDLKITKGDGGTAHYGSTYAFTLNYYYPDYIQNSSSFAVYIGRHNSSTASEVSKSHYVVTQGADKRVVVTLKASYVRTLTDGATYDIIFDTGLGPYEYDANCYPPIDLGYTEGNFKLSASSESLTIIEEESGKTDDGGYALALDANYASIADSVIVYVDEELLTLGDDYILASGSIIVKLTPEYIDTLNVGEHTLTVDTSRGTVSRDFAKTSRGDVANEYSITMSGGKAYASDFRTEITKAAAGLEVFIRTDLPDTETFYRWESTDVEFTDQQASRRATSFVMPGKAVSIEATRYYHVTFQMNGHGTQVREQTVAPGKKATEPADPSASGLIFEDWYEDAAFTTAFNFDKAINQDTIIYARWMYRVTFVSDYGTAPSWKNVDIDKAPTKPADPTADDYVFAEWCTDTAFKKPYDFKTAFDTATNLYAHWKCEVTFSTIHGIAPDKKTIEIGGAPDKPTDPSMRGYKFVEWCTDKALEKKYDFKTAISKNTTLYAKWSSDLKINDGDDGTAHYGSEYDFTLNCDFDQVYIPFELKIDSKTIDPDLYELSGTKNGTIVTLKKALVRSLTAGKHTVVFDTGIDDLGKVSGTLKVSTSPKTGDESDIGLWIAVGCLSAVAAAAIVVYLIRKKK